MGWIQCHYFVKDSTMDNWIFMPRVPQSVLHWWENMVDRGEKGARQGWEGNFIVWSRRTGVKHNTWLSFKRDAMIFAGYHLIGCDSKALWEFRGEQGFGRSEKERKLGGGLVGGWKKKKKTKCKERTRESEGRKDERSRVSERKERNERDRRWRNPLHMSLFTWIYYSCGVPVEKCWWVVFQWVFQLRKKCLLALAGMEKGLRNSSLASRFCLKTLQRPAFSIFSSYLFSFSFSYSFLSLLPLCSHAMVSQ